MQWEDEKGHSGQRDSQCKGLRAGFCCQNSSGHGPQRISCLGLASTKVGGQEGGSSPQQRVSVVRLK